MSRKCPVCSHSQLSAVTADLMARMPYRTIEKKYSIDKSALSRHVKNHVSTAFRQLAAAEKLTDAALVAEPVLAQMRSLNGRALRILGEAEKAQDRPTALHAIRECRRNLELIAKLTGELDSRAAGEIQGGALTINVVYAEKAALVTLPEDRTLPDASQRNGGPPDVNAGHKTEGAGTVLDAEVHP